MEIKHSTVTAVTFKREFQASHGKIYYFQCEMANGDKFEFSTNKQNQTKFVVNNAYNYTIEDKTYKNGNSYKAGDVVKEEKPFTKGYSNVVNKESIMTSAIRFQYDMVKMMRLNNDFRFAKYKSSMIIANAAYSWVLSKSSNKDEQILHQGVLNTLVSVAEGLGTIFTEENLVKSLDALAEKIKSVSVKAEPVAPPPPPIPEPDPIESVIDEDDLPF